MLNGRVAPGVILALVIAGCGRSGPIKVEGIVTVDGEPLANATILFAPENGAGRPASGETDIDGIFHLSTLGQHDGAFPGDYRVTVLPSLGDPADIPHYGKQWEEMSQQERREAYEGPMSRAYGKKSQSRNKRRIPTIPAVFSDVAKTPLRQHVPTQGKVIVELKSKVK